MIIFANIVKKTPDNSQFSLSTFIGYKKSNTNTTSKNPNSNRKKSRKSKKN